MFQRAQATLREGGLAWLLTAGFVTGCGIWSTHFIAMLAYTPGFGFEYDIGLTVGSLIAGKVMTTAGFAIVLYLRHRLSSAIGGAIIGVGIACMHYTGMASLNFVIVWHRDLIATSILLSVVLAIAAVAAARRGDTRWVLGVSASLLTLAITVHHFVAMGAIDIIPSSASTDAARLISPVALCVAIAAADTAILAACLFGFAVDRSAHRQLAERNIQLDAALNNTGQGLCMFDRDSRLILWNAEYLIMYRIRPDALRVGATLDQLMQLRTQAGTNFTDLDEYQLRLRGAIADRTPATWMTTLQDGRSIYVTYQPMANGGWVATHEDYTERMLSQARIEYMAHHDALTDLPNRAVFEQHLEKTILESSQAQASFAVICIDLDRFKDINDMYGHAAGDEHLREVARRLQLACEGTFVARIGGDEFVIVASGGEQPAMAEALCLRVAAAFDLEFMVRDAVVFGSCSMGVGIYPDNGLTGEELIANADAALYRAKSDQRGSVQFFETALDNSLREKRILHKELIAALERNEFEPYFQPQAAINGDIIGFEVLVRWHHPKRGLVAPAVFIPLAEETGLIRSIDQSMLCAACRQAASWSRPLSIAVNLSPVDFRRGDVAAMILAVLFETGLAPNRLHIEITKAC